MTQADPTSDVARHPQDHGVDPAPAPTRAFEQPTAPQPPAAWPAQQTPWPAQQTPWPPQPPAAWPAQQTPWPAQPAPRRTNAMALASVICSVAGVLTGVSVIAGIVLGHLALGEIRRTGEDGRELAIAGLAIGYGLLAVGVLAIIAFIAIFAFMVPVAVTYGT